MSPWLLRELVQGRREASNFDVMTERGIRRVSPLQLFLVSQEEFGYRPR